MQFFDCESRRAFGSSPVSGLKTLNTPKSVKPLPDFQKGIPSHASAATVSAQVSTLVRIASSEYEVRLMLFRPKVTM